MAMGTHGPGNSDPTDLSADGRQCHSAAELLGGRIHHPQLEHVTVLRHAPRHDLLDRRALAVQGVQVELIVGQDADVLVHVVFSKLGD